MFTIKRNPLEHARVGVERLVGDQRIGLHRGRLGVDRLPNLPLTLIIPDRLLRALSLCKCRRRYPGAAGSRTRRSGSPHPCQPSLKAAQATLLATLYRAVVL